MLTACRPAWHGALLANDGLRGVARLLEQRLIVFFRSHHDSFRSKESTSPRVAGL